MTTVYTMYTVHAYEYTSSTLALKFQFHVLLIHLYDYSWKHETVQQKHITSSHVIGGEIRLTSFKLLRFGSFSTVCTISSRIHFLRLNIHSILERLECLGLKSLWFASRLNALQAHITPSSN